MVFRQLSAPVHWEKPIVNCFGSCLEQAISSKISRKRDAADFKLSGNESVI
jgi:hypothetical protein